MLGPKGSCFTPVPSLLGHGVPEGLAASHKALTISRRKCGEVCPLATASCAHVTVCFQLFSGVARLLGQPMAAWCFTHQFFRQPILASGSTRLLHLNCQLSPDLISIPSPSNFRLSLARQRLGLPTLSCPLSCARGDNS